MSFSWKNLNRPVFILGPMANISTLPLMKVCKGFGADILYTPMISSNAVCFNKKETIDIFKFGKKEKPVIVQLFGYDADIMIKAIKIIEKNLKPDGIDINLGCPAPKIIKSMCGSAFLKDYNKAINFVKKIRDNYDGQLSIKTRLGYNKIDILDFLKNIEKIGINAIALHGRTVVQKYSGKANLSIIHKIANDLKTPVILNGDITNWQTAIEEINKSKIKGIMISRGAMARPWIFKEIKEKKDIFFDNQEIAKLMNKHMGYYLKYNNKKAFIEMRKFLAIYLKGFKNAKELRNLAVHIKDKKSFKNLINKIKINQHVY